MQERPEEGTVVVPLVVQVSPIRVEPPAIIVAIGIEPVRVAIDLECANRRLYHYPLNALRVESYSAWKCPSVSHQVSSFLKFLHAPLCF